MFRRNRLTPSEFTPSYLRPLVVHEARFDPFLDTAQHAALGHHPVTLQPVRAEQTHEFLDPTVAIASLVEAHRMVITIPELATVAS